jgi:bifunctional DNA-binding transcriptional regulator/antitoxin component of YhaV-PrlF toxin-antitoxin module
MEKMITETGRIGKRGVMVMPAKLRRRYGLEEGSFIIAEARPEGILIRPLRTAIEDAPLQHAAPPDLAASMETLHALGTQMHLGRFDWEEWKAYRDEGRK